MSKEIVDVVDENGKIIQTTTRIIADAQVLRLQIARVVIYNTHGELLLARRAAGLKQYGGYWDIGTAETVHSQESYEEAALRGLKEELGITVTKNDLKFLFSYNHDSQDMKKRHNVYALIYDGKISPDLKEVSEIKYSRISDLEILLKKYKFFPPALGCFELLKVEK